MWETVGRRLLGWMVLAAVLGACGAGSSSGAGSEAAVEIRVMNISQREISQAWLGHSGDFRRRIELTESVDGFPASP